MCRTRSQQAFDQIQIDQSISCWLLANSNRNAFRSINFHCFGPIVFTISIESACTWQIMKCAWYSLSIVCIIANYNCLYLLLLLLLLLWFRFAHSRIYTKIRIHNLPRIERESMAMITEFPFNHRTSRTQFEICARSFTEAMRYLFIYFWPKSIDCRVGTRNRRGECCHPKPNESM